MLELETVKRLYSALPNRVERVRRKLDRPLTLAEKVLYAHLDGLDGQALERGVSFLLLRPDRVAMQDATAQMAILQFISSGRSRTAVPTTVHCDHLITARQGAVADMETALRENKEVFDFLATASRKYGMGFWRPGSGIIHQVVLENYAVPGGLMIGTDSHTPNAGGMGMLAIGVGGADAVDVMVGMPWEILCPRFVGVRLTGALSGWTAPKDVILKMCELLTCAGGTNKIVEYFGPGVASISLTGRGTITNMGAELGATTSVFPFDARTAAYLRATRRAAVAEGAEKIAAALNADPEVHRAPEKYYDEVVEIDLDRLEPMLVGPHSPDLAHAASRMKADVAKEGYPEEIKAGLIGSCTNSSYEDIGRAAHVARQAVAKRVKARVPLLVTPGSDQVYATLERDGMLDDLKKLGATILANACGPCIGQWKREDVNPEDEASGKPNVIVTSFNRNFRGRNDSFKSTLAFIGSPELVVAKTLAGRLSFNPNTDTLPDAEGQQVKLDPPEASDLPKNGFVFNDRGFQPPAKDAGSVQLAVAPSSERLQMLAPFAPWDGHDLTGARVLLKAKGKCTTDHISAAGAWLRYRGHLDRISDNLYLGAVNAFTGEAGKGVNLRTGEKSRPFPELARDYQAHGIPWIAVGDANFGEGSSREHAALEPRHLGGRAAIVRSFARIHETNLKKQGLLALTFEDPADYEKVQEDDEVQIEGLDSFAPGYPLTLVLLHADGSGDKCSLHHSYNAEQIEWFKAGSALNIIRKRVHTDDEELEIPTQKLDRVPSRAGGDARMEASVSVASHTTRSAKPVQAVRKRKAAAKKKAPVARKAKSQKKTARAKPNRKSAQVVKKASRKSAKVKRAKKSRAKSRKGKRARQRR